MGAWEMSSKNSDGHKSCTGSTETECNLAMG